RQLWRSLVREVLENPTLWRGRTGPARRKFCTLVRTPRRPASKMANASNMLQFNCRSVKGFKQKNQHYQRVVILPLIFPTTPGK
ncbi:MAG: hypothetical protein WEC41_05790, partial [Dongiaceae bacterium]